MMLRIIGHVHSLCIQNFLKTAASFCLRYSMGMTHDEFAIFVQMRYLLYTWDIAWIMLRIMLLSLPTTSVNLLLAYLTYSQKWSLIVVVSTFDVMVVQKLVANNMWTHVSTAHRIIYGRIMSTYHIVSHSKESIRLRDYMEVVKSCLFPALTLPRDMLPMLTELWLSTFGMCYLIYMLDINRYHLCVLIVAAYILRKLLQQNNYTTEKWKKYGRLNDQFFCIKQCIGSMLTHSEVPYQLRVDWGSAHHQEYMTVMGLEIKQDNRMGIYLFLLHTMLYICTMAMAGHHQYTSGTIISLALVYSTIPKVHYAICLIRELASPKADNQCEAEVFPRVLAMVHMHSHKKLSQVPIEYPLRLDFPYAVEVTGCLVKTLDVDNLGAQDTLVIKLGDRVLVNGDSGCGKSSLLKQLFRMNTIDLSTLHHRGYIQWISEGVASTIDYKYLTMQLMFDISTVRCGSYMEAQHALSDAELDFAKCFKLDRLYERCCMHEQNIGKSKQAEAACLFKYLSDVSAGEKQRLHSMTCMWKAIHDPQISTIVWDEGDQGLSGEMFVDILRHMNTLTAGKTLICITHSEAASKMDIWDHMLTLSR